MTRSAAPLTQDTTARERLEPALHALLTASDDDERATLARLREELGAAAWRTGVTDVVYTTVPSPVGPLLVATTARGIVRVAYEREDHDRVVTALAERVGPRVLRADEPLAEAASQLEQYFAGELRRFDLPLDLRLAAGFRREVLDQLTRIDFGRTLSYAEVAMASGHPRAVRAVGTACARNPLPVVVPCHRVVRSDGSTGQYVGGTEAKTTLLALERSGGTTAGSR